MRNECCKDTQFLNTDSSLHLEVEVKIYPIIIFFVQLSYSSHCHPQHHKQIHYKALQKS